MLFKLRKNIRTLLTRFKSERTPSKRLTVNWARLSWPTTKAVRFTRRHQEMIPVSNPIWFLLFKARPRTCLVLMFKASSSKSRQIWTRWVWNTEYHEWWITSSSHSRCALYLIELDKMITFFSEARKSNVVLIIINYENFSIERTSNGSLKLVFKWQAKDNEIKHWLSYFLT